MHGRPYIATLTVRCAVAECDCVREIEVRLFTSSTGSEVVERPYEKECPACGHSSLGHATVNLTRVAPVERRAEPRD